MFDRKVVISGPCRHTSFLQQFHKLVTELAHTIFLLTAFLLNTITNIFIKDLLRNNLIKKHWAILNGWLKLCHITCFLSLDVSNRYRGSKTILWSSFSHVEKADISFSISKSRNCPILEKWGYEVNMLNKSCHTSINPTLFQGEHFGAPGLQKLQPSWLPPCQLQLILFLRGRVCQFLRLSLRYFCSTHFQKQVEFLKIRRCN